MKLRLFCLICCLVAAPWITHAQSANDFSSDRPGLANTPLVVGKHYLQLQFGASLGQYGLKPNLNIYEPTQDRSSDYFFRFGLNRRTELDLGFSLLSTQGLDPNMMRPAYTPYTLRFSHSTRFESFRVGVRHTFFTEEERDFTLGMLLLSNTRLSQNANLANEYGYIMGLLGAKQIGSRISATGNIGLQHQNSFVGPEFFYVVNFAFDLGNNLGVFVETKNESVLIDQPDLVQWFNSGLYWKLTPNFMLDLHGGNRRNVSNTQYSDIYWYAALGLSWKIKAIATKKPKTP
jgi:hypothetical protein